MTPLPPLAQGPVVPDGPCNPGSAPMQSAPPSPFPPDPSAQPSQPSAAPPGYGPRFYAPPGFPPGFGPGFLPGFPPPPRRKRRLLRAAFLTVFFLILCFSLLLNLAQLVGPDASPGRGVVTMQIQSGEADQQIAVVPLEGEIDSACAERFDHFLTRVEENPNVKALVIEIDTPGGSVTASDEIYHRIRRYKDNRKDKGRNDVVVVAMKSMATSGGFYAACAADHLIAEPTTLTGNIGVLMPSLNFSGLLKKYGVEDKTVVSTGAAYKDAGSPFRPEEAKDHEYLQSLADSAFKRFKTVVSDGRGARLVGKIDDLANGKVYAADDAKSAGLIDDIGYPRDAYDYAAKSASLTKPSIVRYQEPALSLASLLFSRWAGGALSSRGGSAGPAGSAGNVTVNGVNVNVGPETLDRFATPRLLYRWRGD